MKKILLLLSAAALWNCTDYAADWDSKYEKAFSENANTPTTPTYSVCEEGATSTLNEGSCVTEFLCQNDSWVPYSYLCNNEQQEIVCEEGLTTSLTDGVCTSNYICSGNTWVLAGDPVCTELNIESSASSSDPADPPPSSASEESSVYPLLSVSTVSTINCSKSMYCPQDCRNSSNTRCGKVYTGLDDGSGTQGWFWTYSDADANGGSSSFYWPEGEGTYGFEPTSRDKLGYLKGVVKFGTGYAYPYARMGFHIKGEESDTDITSWNGMCLVYTATQDFYVTLRFLGDDNSVAYDYFQAKIPATSSKSLVNASWNDFVQEGWGKPFTLSVALLVATKIEFTFKGDAGTTNAFSIYAIGKNGTCN